MSANIVEILIRAKDLTGPALAGVNAKVNSAGSGMKAFHKTALIAGAGLATIGFESVKMASKFDASMTLLHTQAGVAQGKIAGLKKGVLALAGKVGQDPDSLAESLYHVESNFESTGISGSKALKLVEVAAKGATAGHANLVDVTNALTAAVASNIPGVQNMDKAMAVLNATVGTGDMKMQDLANAFGSGMVATVAGFGLSIQDVGAALATFGDANIRGANGGTQLRMSVMALANPVSTAKAALDKLGLTTHTLRDDMQKGGLNLAMQDLVARMHKAGISAKEQGAIITEAFGRKAGAGLNVLVRAFEKFESKYPAQAKAISNIGESWKATQKTFAFQTKSLQSSFDALMITVGTKLIPPLQSVVTLLLAHKGAAIAAAAGLAGLLAATVAVSAAMKVAAASQMLWAAGGKALVGLKGIFETVAQKALYMRSAFTAAGGGVAGLRAAFASLGAMGKTTVVVAGLAAVAAGVMALSSVGKRVPPDVDRMTTALGKLGSTGHVTGEALRIFGKDFGNLAYDVDRLAGKSSGMDKFNDVMNKVFTLGMKKSNSFNMAKEDIDSLDKSLASLVSGGKTELAAAALSKMKDAYTKKGGNPKKLVGELDDYKAALASSSLEEKLTAQSMGLFGDAAVATQKKLDGEAQSAKGLEQSIMALNAVHRGAFDAETAFYAAMSDAHKALKDNGKSLNLNSDAGRKNRDVLSQLAAKTEDLVDKKNKEHVAWGQVDKIYQQGRKTLIDTAMAMGDTRKQAEHLANTLLKTPQAKKLEVKVDSKAARADLNAFNAAVKRNPGSKTVTLKTLSGTAEKVLTSFGFKVTHLKDGSVKITAVAGGALSTIHNVQAAVDSLHGKKVGIGVYTTHYYKSVQQGGAHSGPQLPGMPGAAHGGLLRRASGGSLQDAQHFDGGGYVQGPGGPTSDSILATFASGAAARVSDSEYVVQSSAVRKYGVGLLDALNAGRLKLAGFAKGGHLSKAQKKAKEQAKKAQQRAKAAAQAEEQARHDAMGDLSISHFGRMAGYKRDEFRTALGKPQDLGSLVNALNQWRGIIQKATHGRAETRLLKQLDSAGKKLLAWEKQLTSVTKSLEGAKSKLSSLKDAASQLRDSVKSNLISSANITKGANGDAPVTLNTIRAGMRTSKDKVSAFAGALKQLRAKGFSRSIIQQVAEAGIDGGGLETAGALLQASSSEVKTINQTQADIEKAAKSAGKTTADAVYDKAIKAQERYVKKLEEQQKKLKESMDKLAEAIDKALQKALGGHHGKKGIVGAAASGGIRSSLTWVGEEGPELLDLGAGARVWSNPDSRRKLAAAQAPWTSMLTAPARPSAEQAASAPTQQDQVVVLEIRAGDNGRYTDFLVNELRKAVKVRGGIEPTFAPSRGR
ncbi:phage tail tape measure protein [Streptomyces sp. NPDC006184]|uniref:phage tail tape measure protein n=1 Tax=Streptomyces sp. NPDC006184 TaxID=3155455 RepID=UPI0033B036F1